PQHPGHPVLIYHRYDGGIYFAGKNCVLLFIEALSIKGGRRSRGGRPLEQRSGVFEQKIEKNCKLSLRAGFSHAEPLAAKAFID
ncbi:MAG TPA: hypothetical protein VHH88_01785, partial [Verrucomicrobiae bacterium]|nr:hypothetical protein [Verrucomicrobiae bacterium]